MASDWTESTVGEFCPFKYGKGLPERARVSGAYPVMSSAGVVASHTDPLVKAPGVVIGRKGTAGSVTFAPGPFWPIDTAFYVEDEPEKRDVRFTYYLLQTLGLSGMNSDSAVPGLNRDNAHAVALHIPPLAEQTEIASVLGALDDRIESLRATNETLEAIVQALFKSWFVDFDPVKAKVEGKVPVGMDEETAKLFPSEFEESEMGLIPKGWSVAALDGAHQVQLITKSVMAYEGTKEYLETANIEGTGIVKRGELYSFDGRPSRAQRQALVNSCWFARMQDSRKVVRFPKSSATRAETYILSTGFVGFMPQPSWFSFISALVSSEAFQAEKDRWCEGTTMISLANKALKNIKLILPAAALAAKFDEAMYPIFDLIALNAVEAEKLAELRDALLPKLISGELRLPGFGDNASQVVVSPSIRTFET